MLAFLLSQHALLPSPVGQGVTVSGGGGSAETRPADEQSRGQPKPQEEGPRGSGFWTSQWKVPMCGNEKTGLGGRGSMFFRVQGTGRNLIFLLLAQVTCGARLSTCQPVAKRGRQEDGRTASLGHPSIS